MANLVHAPLLVFSRGGNMPALLSHFRPDYPIFAICDSGQVARHLCLFHGVQPLVMPFEDSFEASVDAALAALAARGFLAKGRLVAVVQSGRRPIWRRREQHAIQLRRVEARHVAGGGGPGAQTTDESVEEL